MLRWIRDIRFATRVLRASPGFAFAAIATLGIGVGATAAIFAIVAGVLLRPLPIASADRVVAFEPTASLEEIRDWQHTSRTLDTFAAWRDWGMTRHADGRTEPAFGIIATPDLFHVLPVAPLLGRTLTSDDDHPGANRVVLLTYEYWRDRFGADPTVVGRSIRLERVAIADYQIVGVLPAAFTALPSFADARLVAPSSIDPDAGTGRDRRNRRVFARLAPAASLASAREEMRLLADADHPVAVASLIEHEIGAQAGVLRTFLGAVAFVLIIACANIAALQLARAITRRREFSIRQALGDSRGGIGRSLIAESVLLAPAAVAIGVPIASALVEFVLASGPPIPRASAVAIDGWIFGAMLLLAIVSGLLVAVPASLLATRTDVAPALKEESGAVTNAKAARMRSLFVSAQVALALVLAGGALVAAQSFVSQLTLRPGFDPRALWYVPVVPPAAQYETGDRIARLYAELISEARAVPGVEGASATSAAPLSGEGAEPAEFLNDANPDGKPFVANTFNVAPGHFATLGVPLRGRDFGNEDAATAGRVAIVNETFARRFLASGDPIGTRLRLARGGEAITIVGVSGDVLREFRPGAAAAPEIYWPYSQRPRWATMLLVRGSVNPVLERVRAVDPVVRIGAPRTMDDRISRSFRAPRFTFLLFMLFAGTAACLSAVGVYGLVSYTFAQRTREIGIRISLGATSNQVLALVARSGFSAVLAGSLAGCIGLVALSRPMAAAMPDLGTIGPMPIAAAWLALVVIGCAACYLPARRAAHADPIASLRSSTPR